MSYEDKYWQQRTFTIEASTVQELEDKLNGFFETQYNKGNLIIATQDFSEYSEQNLAILVTYKLKPTNVTKKENAQNSDILLPIQSQEYFLKKRGIDISGLNKTEAIKLISEIKEREKNGSIQS